jgi:2-methylisocitrate lyase-like PEP mutase family enzyme
MGYKIALYPISALLACAAALEQVYSKLLSGKAEPRERVTFSQYNEIVGLPDFLATAKRLDTR